MHVIKKIPLIIVFCLCGLCLFADTAAASVSPTITTGLTVGVILAIFALVISFFVFGGIKYVTPENVLETVVRKNLYEYLDEFPGSHLREIARELNLKPSNAAWHLRKLEQTNLIRSRLIGGKKVFYLVEGGVETRKLAIAESILRNENAKSIMDYLASHPGKHLLEISQALGLNHHVVKWHLKKMYEAELVDGDTSNSAYPVYYPTDVGYEAVENFCDPTKKVMKVAS